MLLAPEVVDAGRYLTYEGAVVVYDLIEQHEDQAPDDGAQGDLIVVAMGQRRCHQVNRQRCEQRAAAKRH